MAPSCPDGVDARAFGDVDDVVHVGVVVVIGPAGYFDVPVRHSNVIRVHFEILWSGHDRELDGAFCAEGLV